MTSRIDIIGQNGNDGEHYDKPVIKCNFKVPGQLCGKMKVKINSGPGELCSLPMGECDCQEDINPEPVLVGDGGAGSVEPDNIYKEIAIAFYRQWHNSPGTNTDQGFDDWWEINKARYLGE